MVKKLIYITYQTFPAKTANSIQTISVLKHINRIGFDTVLIYPMRNRNSSKNLDEIKNHYEFKDNLHLIGTIHPLPFQKVKIFEKYWYLISHFLWSFFTVRKYYSSENELYLTRSEWVFYFLSKKNANVIYECHQVSKLKKILVNLSLKNEKSKVVALTSAIKNQLETTTKDKIEIIGSSFDDDYFFNTTEKKNNIVYSGSLYRFGQTRGLEILFENSLDLGIEDLKVIIILSDEEGIESFKDKIKDRKLGFDLQILHKLNQKQVGEILSSAKVGLLVNNTSEHASLYSSPLKYFEYLASGLNVVATDLSSHRELPLNDSLHFYDADNFNSFHSALMSAIKSESRIDSSIRDYSTSKRVSKILDLF
tara:strand:- start:7058 stop:8155 length:1098 start_codon:yes stop_codon:yes gene_type:complete